MKTSILCLVPLITLTLSAETVQLETTAAFHGTSTLHDFDGTATASPSRADWQPEVNGGILTAPAITFEVTGLSTDHLKRDKNMMKMLDPEEFPQITGSLKNWKLGAGMEDAPHLLELQIHGTTVEVPVILDAFTKEEDGYLLTCHFPLSLKACNLKRPSVLGLIRVGDEVLVHVQTRIRPASE